MAVEVTLPRQGWSMEEAAFVEWLKKDGDRVKPGDPLFSVETDKTVQEIESLDEGILCISPKGPCKGDRVHVGDVVGYLAQAGEAVSFDKPQTAREDARPPKAVPPVSGGTRPPGASRAMRTSRTTPMEQRPRTNNDFGNERPAAVVTPRAAKRALQEGVDLRAVKGSGAAGRIREQDVIAARRGGSRQPEGQAPTPPPPWSTGALSAGREIPLSGLRRTIAQRMTASKTLTAPVTLTTHVDATALVSLRERLKAEASLEEPAPSYSDIVIALVAGLLKKHPALNAQWAEDRIIQANTVNIGLAVDTEAGLLVPVVRDAPSLSLRQMAIRTRDLIERARQRELTTEEMSGGTFTVSNLGGMGVDAFTPIINHPECAVLGMGRITREPTIEVGQLVLRSRMWLSLTFDHRIVDGAPAARFLDALRRSIGQNPS